jgi:plastocyanin
MKRIMGVAMGLAALFAAAPAPAQAAQEVVVTGLDTLTWDRPVVDIQPGDSVRWAFTGTTQVHNVKSTSPNWELRSPLGPAPAPTTDPYTFNAVGEYTFVCEVHSGMTGTVRVAEGPPPPPPVLPPSQQPFTNDFAAPVALETAVAVDKTKPGLSSLSVKRRSKGARVRFKVSEESAVGVVFSRGGKIVKTYAVESGSGTRALNAKGLRRGRYVVTLVAVDIAGNKSKARKLRVTVT